MGSSVLKKLSLIEFYYRKPVNVNKDHIICFTRRKRVKNYEYISAKKIDDCPSESCFIFLFSLFYPLRNNLCCICNIHPFFNIMLKYWTFLFLAYCIAILWFWVDLVSVLAAWIQGCSWFFLC